MAICPDCGEEKELKPRAGICNQCYVRKANAKHRGKPYIKLIDDNRPVRRKRLDTNQVHNDSNNLEREELYSDEIKNQVREDIAYNLKLDKVNIDSNMNFELAFNVLESALNCNSYINNFFKAGDIFNRLESDYKHGIESAKTRSEKSYWQDLYSYLLDERRKIKRVISEYESGGYIFNNLHNDEKFMKEFEEAKTRFEKVHKMNDEGLYRQISNSKIVEKAGFCIGKKNDISRSGMSKWNVIVKSITPNIDPFSRVVWAYDEKEAIDNVLSFMKKVNWKFPFKNPEGITVRKLTLDSGEEFL